MPAGRIARGAAFKAISVGKIVFIPKQIRQTLVQGKLLVATQRSVLIQLVRQNAWPLISKTPIFGPGN